MAQTEQPEHVRLLREENELFKLRKDNEAELAALRKHNEDELAALRKHNEDELAALRKHYGAELAASKEHKQLGDPKKEEKFEDALDALEASFGIRDPAKAIDYLFNPFFGRP